MTSMRRDRRELAFLGALLLGWALVLAPVVHVLVGHAARHAHGHSHGPAQPDDAPHGQGSLEHGSALVHATAAAPALFLVLVSLASVAEPSPQSPCLAVWPRVEQSQGP